LVLTSDDERRLAEMLRCDPRDIRELTHLRSGQHRAGLIATTTPLQVCRRCAMRHQTDEVTDGARLRSWMEGWRLSCPVCGAPLEDTRPLDVLTKVDATNPLLVRAAAHARKGELLINRAMRRARRTAAPLIELMRVLLMPRLSAPADWRVGIEKPRLLNVVVPGFDRYMRLHHPDFCRPGTLLLPIGVRVPVLAGLAVVVATPHYWAKRMLKVASKGIRDRLVACFRSLLARHLEQAQSLATSRSVSGHPSPKGLSVPEFSEIAA